MDMKSKEMKHKNTTELTNERGHYLLSRREFLKRFGFGILGSAVLAACQKTPVKYILPYRKQPTDVQPGVSNWYASAFFDGEQYSSIVVKTREGRPIKIEGNDLCPVTKGGVFARGQASVLSLYDEARLHGPVKGKNKTTWKVAINDIKNKLSQVGEGNIVFLTNTIISPTTLELIKEFKEKYPTTKHVVYDAVSYSGLIEAFGGIPRFYFDKANVIVSFGADFLGTWLSPVEFAKGYAKNRKYWENESKRMSRHYQFESHFSMTGANADHRVSITPTEEVNYLLALYNEIAKATGGQTISAPKIEGKGGQLLKAAAKDLLQNKGKSLVIATHNDKDVQSIVYAINKLLGNIGNTIDIKDKSFLRQGKDSDFEALLKDMEAGKVKAIFIYGANPAYNYPDSKRFVDALKKVDLKVAFADRVDETAQYCDYVLPTNHYLESWDLLQPYLSTYTIMQPTINPLFDTKQFAETLMLLLERPEKEYYEYIKNYVKNNVYPKSGSTDSFEMFFVKSIHDGVINVNAPTENGKEEAPAIDINAIINNISKTYSKSGEIELVLYENVAIGDGSMANNPWLQEMPDPLTRVVWDNYAIISPKMARSKGLKTGDIINISVGNKAVEVPVFVLPGQNENTISVAVGYGRTRSAGDRQGEYVAGNKGVNVYPLVEVKNGSRRFRSIPIKEIKKVGEGYLLAQLQLQPTAANRLSVIRETTLDELDDYLKKPEFELLKWQDRHPNDMYPPYDYENYHHWAMAIDMNSCIGCGACVVSCIAENNIPIVGKEEIARGRDMHWIRIDRYFTPREDNPLEPADDPEVTFQPMLCQHCDNAPCENVCPVMAIEHSKEGLNQQVYNRCVGTRYCANNCPYKVRRFNWFDYTDSETWKFFPTTGIQRMVLNPDVVVRARGTMEKCTFCVQRIQLAKLEAKKEGRPLRDGEVKTACQQSCPTDAIIFGDLNDPNSKISKYFKHKYSYRVIEEVKTYPSVSYKIKVRNKIKS